MSLTISDFSMLMLVFFVVATLYSSVGFGGGSSYLAILALIFTGFFVIRSTALVCNLVVVTSSCYLFLKKGHLNLKRFLPFLLTSIPMAFLGAIFRLGESIFFVLLGTTLIFSSLALILQTRKLKTNYKSLKYPKYLPYFIGAFIGLLSGLVGIGGGIFLAPILNQLKWDKPIVIAALASVFILSNSIAGIIGLIISGTFEVFWPEIIGLLIAVLAGGQIGVRLSLNKISAKGIRLLTAFLVLFVGVRVLLNNGLQINLFS